LIELAVKEEMIEKKVTFKVCPKNSEHWAEVMLHHRLFKRRKLDR